MRGAERAGLRAVLLDPYGDWLDTKLGFEVPTCETVSDVPTLVARLLAESDAEA